MAKPIEPVNHGHGGAPIKQYCKHGHDTFAIGRTTSGHCRACTRERRKAKEAA